MGGGGGDGGKDLDTTESTGLTVHRKVPLLAVAVPWSRTLADCVDTMLFVVFYENKI